MVNNISNFNENYVDFLNLLSSIICSGYLEIQIKNNNLIVTIMNGGSLSNCFITEHDLGGKYTYSEDYNYSGYTESYHNFEDFPSFLSYFKTISIEDYCSGIDVANNILNALQKIDLHRGIIKYNSKEEASTNLLGVLLLKQQIINVYSDILKASIQYLVGSIDTLVGYDPFLSKTEIEKLNEIIEQTSHHLETKNTMGIFDGLLSTINSVKNYFTNIKYINSNIVTIYSNIIKPIIEQTEKSITTIKKESSKSTKLTVATAIISIIITTILSIISIILSIF